VWDNLAYRLYKKVQNRFVTNKSKVEEVLKIFERSGSSDVITQEIVGNDLKVLDFIVKSESMEQGLNKVALEIDRIINSREKCFGSYFYFSRYGGSKTQFIAMLNDYFIKEKPKVIPIIFNDITAINSENIFNQIIPRTFEKINLEIEDKAQTYKKFLEIQNLASQIQIGLLGGKSKNQIIKNLKEIDSLTNEVGIKSKIKSIEELIENIQIADDDKVMDLISKIMAETSKLDFLYLFFFDEVDLWFNEEEPLEFSQKLINKTRIMKKILDFNQSGSKLYYIFSVSDLRC